MKHNITKFFTRLALIAGLMVSTAGSIFAQTYVSVLSFNCANASTNGSQTAYGVNSSTVMTATGIDAFLEAAAGTTNKISVSGVSGSVYWAKGTGGDGIPDACLKVGKASGSGAFTFTIDNSYDAINRVVITGYGWKNTSTISINSLTGQKPSTAATETTFTFDLTSSTRSFALSVTTSAICITKIELFKQSGSAVATTTTISDSEITNTDVYVSTTAGSLSATVKDASDNTISGASVTWNGNNDAVATINANTGAVMLVSAGTVKFTASYAGEAGAYLASSAEYTMTVTSSAPYVQPTEIEILPNYTFWGKTAQFSGNTYDELSGSKDNVTLDWSRGNGSTYANQNAMRFYKDNELTFTAPAGYEIKSIELDVSGTFGDLEFSPDGWDGTNTIWSGSSASVTMSRPSNASSYATINTITITIGAPSSVTTPTFSPDDGTTFGNDGLDVTISATSGTIYYTLDGSAPTTSSSVYSSAIHITATTTIKAIAVNGTDVSSVASATYTYLDPNRPGTQNNPYTVAQARAAIDAETSTTGVYATGIVSEIVEAYSSNYGNISYNISADGTTSSDQLQAYRGKSYNGDNFTSADDIQVGDEVVVYGNLTKYNSTYEFAQNNQLVSLVRPVVPIIVAENVTIEHDATSGEIVYSISNATQATLAATCSADWISNINVTSTKVTFTATANEGNADRTATFTLTYTGATSKTVTVTQKHFVPDFATLPFEWAGGASAAFKALAGVTTSTLGSDYAASNSPYLIKFSESGQYIQVKTDSQPDKVTIGVKMIGGDETSTITVQASADGTTFSNVEALTISGEKEDVLTLQTSNSFASTDRYVKLVFTKGSNVGIGPITITKHSDAPSIVVTPASANPAATDVEGTLDIEYENLTISDMTDFGVQFCDSEGNALASENDPSWIVAMVAEQDPSIGEGYVVSFIMDPNEGEARSAYFKIFALGATDYVYSNLVTITQAAYVAPPSGNIYSLFTGDLVEGDYIIYYSDGAMNNYVESKRLQYEEISPANGVICTDDASIIWHIAPSGNYWTIYNAEANAYAASTDSKNQIQLLDIATDNKALWSVSATDGALTYDFINKDREESSTNPGNKYLRKNSTYGFACYASTQGGALTLYKNISAPTSIEIPAKLYNGRYWATFCSRVARYTLPEGAQAFTMNAQNQLYRLGTTGREIPANTAVIIITDSAEMVAGTPKITLTISDATDTISINGGDNILQGSDFQVRLSGFGESEAPYVLGVPEGNSMGLYEYTGTGANAYIPANKAYYVDSE